MWAQPNTLPFIFVNRFKCRLGFDVRTIPLETQASAPVSWRKTGRMAEMQFGPAIKFTDIPVKIEQREKNK
jgi:hypothetical protein